MHRRVTASARSGRYGAAVTGASKLHLVHRNCEPRQAAAHLNPAVRQVTVHLNPAVWQVTVHRGNYSAFESKRAEMQARLRVL